MKILLTGTNGFIGRNIQEILGDKYNIVTPKRLELDLLNDKDVLLFLEKNSVDIVLHAASVGVICKSDSLDITQMNLQMFFNLVNAKKYYKRLIVLGSGAEYDKRKKLNKVKEKFFDLSIPNDQYGFSKYVMAKYAQQFDFITHLRLFGVFGKYEDYQTRFISNSICKALFDLPITINQNVYFDYIYVNDLVEIIDKVIQNKPKETFYNVGSGQQVDLITIAKIILEVTKKDLPVIIKKDGLNNEYTCDISKLKNEFGDFNFNELKTSISELVYYYSGILDSLNKEEFVKDF